MTHSTELSKQLAGAARNVSSAHKKIKLIAKSSKYSDAHFRIQDLEEVLNECKKQAEGFFTDCGVDIAVVCPKDLTVVIDRDRILRVLMNLVSNSVYFLKDLKHRSNKKVVLSGEAIVGGGAHIICEDNGPGIAKENFPEVFNYYYTTKGEKGLGFGLAIAKEIIETIHGGSIRIQSDLGFFTRFIITLPVINI